MAQEEFALLVVGSRSISDYDFVSATIDRFILPIREKYSFLIVSGGADGVDSLADRYAEKNRIDFRRFPVDWKRYGDGNGKVNKKAGYMRNRRMHEFISGYEHRGCIIIWDGKSKGSLHSIELSKEFGTPYRLVKYEGHDEGGKLFPRGLTPKETDALDAWFLEMVDKFVQEEGKHDLLDEKDVLPAKKYYRSIADAFCTASTGLNSLERGTHIHPELKKHLDEHN